MVWTFQLTSRRSQKANTRGSRLPYIRRHHDSVKGGQFAVEVTAKVPSVALKPRRRAHSGAMRSLRSPFALIQPLYLEPFFGNKTCSKFEHQLADRRPAAERTRSNEWST